MTKKRFAWLLLIASTVGFVICMWLWLADRISDRAMLGITLALSWLAVQLTALDGLWVVQRDDKGS